MNDDRWLQWCLMWYAIGWHEIASRSNFGTGELLQVCAALLFRVARLEALQQRSLLGWML